VGGNPMDGEAARPWSWNLWHARYRWAEAHGALSPSAFHLGRYKQGSMVGASRSRNLGGFVHV